MLRPSNPALGGPAQVHWPCCVGGARAARIGAPARPWRRRADRAPSTECAPRRWAVLAQAAADSPCSSGSSSGPQQQQHPPPHSTEGLCGCSTSGGAAGAPPPHPSLGRRAALASTAAAAAALAAPRPRAASAGPLVDEATARAVFESASPSVVAIVQFKTTSAGGEAFEALGSGVVWDDLGHVVTNYHVVGQYVLDRTGAAGVKVIVQGPDGGSVALPATIVGTDAQREIAVLSLEGGPPPGAAPLPVGASAGLRVGQTVYALGARYGEGASMSAGVVSGLGRAIPAPTGTRIYGVVQTDASVNAANSGGALVDSSGRLVGLATAPFTSKSTARGSGVGFALPTEMLREVVPNLIVYGSGYKPDRRA
ncbi:protease Do-like chloroplastic [Raphidocelis subcapitata]|uniref:Protease Do-like chloroplastic n=1 Tax=Raphidocelis subcapitata TaxID=307507 RepID=A0A2V0P323_9CHLO|nr:protease Do-like chloroplastic [Raphidocelis subcapitata]|eukprot:GBF94268.1 protease Do-like chloroplastic [Raphidocelis subcapitata]